MKVVCGLKQKMDNESLSSCFSSPKKNKYITRYYMIWIMWMRKISMLF